MLSTLKVLKADKPTSYMWLYCCGDDSPKGNTNIVLYDYHNSRAGQCAVDFLEGFSGYLQVDGYQAYAQTDATLVACLAHIRRKFIEAKGNNKKTGKADVVLNLIGKLYGIEQQIKAKSADEKYVIRQQKSNIIIDELHQWLLQHQDKIPPKMALGKAILYALNQFEKFRRYLNDGRLSIDNNRAFLVDQCIEGVLNRGGSPRALEYFALWVAELFATDDVIINRSKFKCEQVIRSLKKKRNGKQILIEYLPLKNLYQIR